MVLPRWFLLVGGWLFTVLAFLGAILPLVPTTPFLLLACYCFARSSPRTHERILAMPIFGRYLRQWNRTHTVPRSAKVKGLIVIALSFGLSGYLVPVTWARVLLVVLALTLAVLVWRLPMGEDPGKDLAEEMRNE